MYTDLIIRKVALAKLRNHLKYSFIESTKEKEIIVWIRLQKDMDKNQIIDFIQHKFGLELERTNVLYYKALPEGLSYEELQEVKKVNEKTYYANGGTALYDAIGTSIDNYLDDLSTIKKNDRSNKTLFVILTDGQENASRVYHRELIKLMVTQMREEFNAEFIYLGANQDSCFEAESMGRSRSNAFNYDATDDGITVAYSNISTATSYYESNDVKDNLFQQ